MKYIQLVTDPSKVMKWEGKSVIAFNKTSKKVMFGGEEGAPKELWICYATVNSRYHDEDIETYYFESPTYDSYAELISQGYYNEDYLERVEDSEWYGYWAVAKVVECSVEEALDEDGNEKPRYWCISHTTEGYVYCKMVDLYVNNIEE